MFTNNKAKYFGDNKVLIEAACLKTDSKPTTDIANGSKCIEMDTGKTYMFNEEDSEWEELPSSGGGGGGAEPLIVTHTDDIDVGVTRLNVTFGELFEAFESGASIYSYHDDGSNKEWREMASIGRSDDDQYGHSGWIQFGDSERYNTEWLSTEEAMLQAYPSMPLD